MDSIESTLYFKKHPVRCSACGLASAPEHTDCPHCGAPLVPVSEEERPTINLKRTPRLAPLSHRGTGELSASAGVILQLLPSGTCLTLSLLNPVILGRGGSLPGQEVFDLTPYNAFQHGISRLHCRLERVGQQLKVIDLGSTNGTYLNDSLLTPHEQYTITEGDRLILGTLHLIVFFSESTAAV